MKRVLIITYYFPPSGGPAVQRILRILKYLPRFKWQPVVLTVKDGDYPTHDLSLLKKISPDVPVHSTFIPEPYKFYRRFTRKSSGEALDLSALPESENTSSFKEKIAFFLRAWLFIPDPRIGWLPFAVFKGLRLLKNEQIDLIFSSAPPNTVHVIAYFLRKFSNKKWVADFRDPWFKYLAPKRNYRIPQKMDEWLCRLVLNNCDHAVFVSDGVGEELRANLAKALPGSHTTIFNGFDEEDFKKLHRTEPTKFTICYVGSFFNRYDLSAFIAATEQVCHMRTEFKEAFELLFCGRVEADVEKTLRQASFAECVRFLGYQEHARTLEIMSKASLLLLYIIDSAAGKHIPTSKLYEYLGVRKPIFALAPKDSEAAEIIRRTRAGVIVSPADKQAIANELVTLFDQWQASKLAQFKSDDRELSNFESKNLVRKLAHIFEEV